jgi:ribosomal protein S18 acetylase RimI-like enzyme
LVLSLFLSSVRIWRDWQIVLLRASKALADPLLRLQNKEAVRWLVRNVQKIIPYEYEDGDIKDFMDDTRELFLILGLRFERWEILGFAHTYKVAGGVPFVCGIGVKKSQQGKGLGRKLLTYVLQFYRKHVVVEARIRVSNDSSQALFDKVSKDVGRTIIIKHALLKGSKDHRLGPLMEINCRLNTKL